MTVHRLRGWCLLCLVACAWPTAPVSAQDRGEQAESARKKPTRKASAKAAAKSKVDAKPKSKAEVAADKPHDKDSTPAAEPKTAHKPPAPAHAEDDVHSEGGTEVKVLEFSGLDIEGQLKTPQMLYFLRRLRAEFGRPNLPHRSFLPELEQTTKDEEF